MFLFTIRARVNPRAKYAGEWSDVGGAYVSCYVSFKNFDIAEKIAKWALRDHGWIPEVRTEAWKLQKSKLKTKKDKQYYAEALRDGYCLVFNCWLADAHDANIEYGREP
jgi:hypothetical protein